MELTHICDRSIGPNALGSSNQSQRSLDANADQRRDLPLFPQRFPVRTPSAPEGSGEKQEPHVSTSHTQGRLTTQPDSPAQYALPHHNRPSIIDKVKRDDLLLWEHQ